MSAPVGPTGCEGDGKAASAWFVGAAVGTTDTDLRFEDDSELSFAQHALTAAVGYRFASGWSVRGAVGAVLGGALEGDGREHEMGTGFVASISGARQWTFGASRAWFVTGSASIAGASTNTQERGVMGDDVGLTAFDVRFGALAGRTFFDRWQPYILGRFFGGPVLWTVDGEDITGTDTTHIQLGVGSSLATSFGLTVVADVSLLGERSASLGLSWSL